LRSQQAIHHQRPNSEEGGQFEPNSLAVSPDGRRLAAAGYLAMKPSSSASVVETLDADNLQTIQSTRQSPEVLAIAFIDGGKSLAVLQSGALEIWDAETLKPKTHLALQLEIDHLVGLGKQR
jgi:WD40 repeat protein